ncbi:MAG: ethanolamine ammonia-lyase reactivating factor EutA [Bacteroidetes bacterium]|nr:ethanolamine ammonia-lyase reactivating factor EutA [Bacteroidota bacterium]
MKFGAIDIGTNAARLLVGEVCQDGQHHYVKKISYTRIPLRLGDDVFDNGKISKIKQGHFVDSILAFKLIAGIFEVEELRAVATSAMREAKNADKVLSQIKSTTGIDIEVISGQEEAELIFGTFMLLDFDKKKSFIVVDVGGGSTEISVFENGTKTAAKSFEIGTIRLLKEKVNQSLWYDISNWIKHNVDFSTNHQLFGTGGNINKIHKIIGLKDKAPVDLKSMKKLFDNLKVLSVDERIDRFQLKPDRADVIVPALSIYLHVMNELNCNEVSVPKIGLSDGMIYEMYRRRGI